MSVQRRRYRLRFLNASNARDYSLRLSNGATLIQVAGDGGLLTAPVWSGGIRSRCVPTNREVGFSKVRLARY